MRAAKKIGIHFTIWILYTFYELSILLVIDPSTIHPLEVFFGFVLNAALFYGTVYFILSAPTLKKYHIIFLKLIFVILLYMFLSFLLVAYILPHAKGMPAARDTFVWLNKVFIAQHIWRATWFISIGAGYWFAENSVLAEKKLRLMERKNHQKELQAIELNRQLTLSQLAFFKTQINPHFLFNTLNFFYSSIYQLSKPLAESLLLLSNIMRYVIKNDDEEGMVDLQEEISLIEDYIELNQLRFDHELNIVFEINGDPENKRVVSFLMMTLVENAFKYGDLSDGGSPLLVKLDISGEKITFLVENKINPYKPSRGSNGIGLSNLRTRLQAIYKNNYSFSIRDQDNCFSCTLTLIA